MEVSRKSAMAPWAIASVGAFCAVQSVRGLANYDELSAFWRALGFVGLAVSAWIFCGMLFRRLKGDRSWGAPPYSTMQAHLIFWSSSLAALCSLALWVWRGS
jgi:hypothetical protein